MNQILILFLFANAVTAMLYILSNSEASIGFITAMDELLQLSGFQKPVAVIYTAPPSADTPVIYSSPPNPSALTEEDVAIASNAHTTKIFFIFQSQYTACRKSKSITFYVCKLITQPFYHLSNFYKSSVGSLFELRHCGLACGDLITANRPLPH